MVTTNYALGWAATYNPEMVALKVKVGEGVYDPPEGVPVTHASRAAATLDQADTIGLKVVTFNLWKAKLARPEGGWRSPKPDDEIFDGQGVTWQIRSVEVCDFGERFRCKCLEMQ